MSNVFDCLVTGNGRASLALAAALAKAGHTAVLVRAEKRRCPQAGEIVPADGWSLLAELVGAAEECQPLETAWPLPVVDHDGRLLTESRCPSAATPPLAGRLVRSSDVDLLLLRAAERSGVQIRTAVDAPTSARLGAVVESRFQEPDGRQASLQSRSLVQFRSCLSDAPLERPRASVRKSAARVAIWGYYKRVGPPPGGISAGPLVVQSADPRCRFWMVPLSGDVTSVGFVGPRDLVQDEHAAIATVFEEQLTGCPAVLDRLITAELVGPLHRQCDADQSEFLAGEPAVSLPCQWRQIDPLFGGQVVLDLAMGVWMARSLDKGLRTGDLSAERLDQEIAAFLSAAEGLAEWIDGAYATLSDRDDVAAFRGQFAALSRRLLWPGDSPVELAAENDPKPDAPEVATLPRG